jgi:hypothetical protein
MEKDPHQHIEAAPADSVEVPDTSYYRRRIATGELLIGKRSRSSAKQPAQEPVE